MARKREERRIIIGHATPATPRKRQPVRWHVLYYILAIFNLGTIAITLFLGEQAMRITWESVDHNRAWAQRLEQLGQLGELATRCGQPGNEVFDNGNVVRERASYEAARERFDAHFNNVSKEIADATDIDVASRLLSSLGSVILNIDQHREATMSVFDALDADNREEATHHLAKMNRFLSQADAFLSELLLQFSEEQTRELAHRASRAQSLQRFKSVIAVLVVAFVIGMIWYGHRLAVQMRTSAETTEQTLAEREEAEAKIRTILETAPDAMLTVSSDGVIEGVNPAAEVLFGYRQSQVSGHPVGLLIQARPADTSRVPAELFRPGRCEAWGQHLDGNTFPLDIAVSTTQTGPGATFTVIARDISDQKRIERDLRRAKDSAEKAMFARTQFLANMSHELRTPLNGVIGMTGLLLESELTPEQRERADIARNSGEILLDIINNILDFSKLESTEIELEDITFDLRGLLQELADLLAPEAQHKEVEFILDIDPALPTHVQGDPTRLRQVLMNLTKNAIKFTEKGEVVIEVRPLEIADEENQAHSIVFVVRDTGIGIPEDRKSRLFKPFSQIDASDTRRFGGTGLGLAISKQIVEAMGGTIEVKSKPEQGSRFSFEIDLDAAIGVTPTPAPMPPKALEGKRIIVVDDNATNRFLLHRWIEAWGCTCEEFTDGESVLKALDEHPAGTYTIGLLDFHMPGMDGGALCREIRKRSDHDDMPLLLLTSVPRSNEAARILEDGFAAYLTKPLKPDVLQNVMLQSLAHSNTPITPTPSIRVTQASDPAVETPCACILLAEDNAVNQKVAKTVLERDGHLVDTVWNGQEALKALDENSYDLVLMDCQMPVMDGLEATASHSRTGRRETGGHTIPSSRSPPMRPQGRPRPAASRWAWTTTSPSRSSPKRFSTWSPDTWRRRPSSRPVRLHSHITS